MMPGMYETGSDLLRAASFALAAEGYVDIGENLLRMGMELLEGATREGEIDDRTEDLLLE